MAEIDTGGGKKVSTKIDMTPMVDLAFLLITFFMLTTTFSKPQAMEVNMPDKTDDNKTQKIKASRALTVILGKDNRIYYYNGLGEEVSDVSMTDFSDQGIRKILVNKRKTVKDPIVLIKSMKEARYKNMVDMLDEMSISGIEIYALVDISPEDLDLVEKSNTNFGIK